MVSILFTRTAYCVLRNANIPFSSFTQELFKKVIPHQCLGAVWSRRNKSHNAEAASIQATVGQFNAVSFRVMSTILMDPNLKLIDRANRISAWIDIAQVCVKR